jgi:hypothetical protein
MTEGFYNVILIMHFRDYMNMCVIKIYDVFKLYYVGTGDLNP